jgi:hypothetical protein
MADVFISYSRADRARVAPVAAALEASGLRPWWDTKLGSGEDYGMVIEREIAASGAQMHAMGKAMAAALPAMVEAFGKAAEELGKATANLPDPTYPNR